MGESPTVPITEVSVDGEIPESPFDAPSSAPASALKTFQLTEEDVRKMEAAFGVSATTNAPAPEQMVLGDMMPAMPMNDSATTNSSSTP